MIRAHKIRLNPNNKQATQMRRTAGVSRAAFNWGLATWQEMYEASKLDPEATKPTRFVLEKKLNAIKHQEMPWMLEVTTYASKAAIADLGSAFSNFFSGRSKYPKFKKKSQSVNSFRLSNQVFKVVDKKVYLPKIGWVEMAESLRLDGRIVAASVSERAGHWYISIRVEITPKKDQAPSGSVTGIDFGVKTLLTLADGSQIVATPQLRKQQAKLRRLNRELHRRKLGSKNRAKTKHKLSKLHHGIAERRKDSQHKATSAIASNYQIVGLEDLSVSGMVKNRNLALSVSDQGFHELRRQLEYKTEERGGQVVLIDRWFPSSKMCSTCGVKNQDLTLKTRNWACLECGTHHDRDVNAAVNILNETKRILSLTAGGSSVDACGGEGSGQVNSNLVKPAPMKQELAASTNR